MSPRRNQLARLLALEVPLLSMIQRRRRRRKRIGKSYRSKTFSNKHLKGFFYVTYPSLRDDPSRFFKYFRMNANTFDLLLSKLQPFFPTGGRQRNAIVTNEEKLALTLRYLASGDYQCSLAFAFCIPFTSVTIILKETLGVICSALQEEMIPFPTMQSFQAVAAEFWARWNLPLTCGALDGKHVMIEKPRGCGSLYRNYKDRDSIVLLAMCDARYRFLFIDIGQFGGRSDGGVFGNSELGIALESGTVKLPGDAALPGTNVVLPHFIVADDAFGFRPWLMKPYSGQNLNEQKLICNYRISRARRVIENSFGILSARWRIFRRPIQAAVTTVDRIVHAACCLHNFCMDNNGTFQYFPHGFADIEAEGVEQMGQWRQITATDTGLNSLNRWKGHRLAEEAIRVRNQLSAYLSSDVGSAPCPWQLQYIRRGRV